MKIRTLLAGFLISHSVATLAWVEPGRAENLSRFIYSFYLGDAAADCGASMRQGPAPGSIICEARKDGREFVIEVQVISQYLVRRGSAPKASIDDPNFWRRKVTDIEKRALSARLPKGGKVIKSELVGGAGPIIAGSRACVRYRYDIRYLDHYLDNEGIRCLFYDPTNDVMDMVLLQYEEIRRTGTRHPNLSKEAEKLLMTLKQVQTRQ